MNDLVPLLEASIARVKALKELKAKRLNLWLARAELAKAVREVEKVIGYDRPLPHELSDIAAISDERRNS